MDPNPQSALPLPPQPNRERYHKLAKELVRACLSDQPSAVDTWCRRWLRALAPERENPPLLGANDLAAFAHRVIPSSESGRRPGLLAKAQYVVARAHGFDSWPRFMHHLVALETATSREARFEAAADAIVHGAAPTLERLLAADPDLVRQRSTRQHGATLLHYVAANGVETFRQKSPPNIVAVTRLLLDGGADLEATASVYRGHFTTLELAATSEPPEKAGVQEALLSFLLDRGARFDVQPRSSRSLVDSCLGNGRLPAAELLARHGAPIDLAAAAGIGDLERLRLLLQEAPAVSHLDLMRAVGFAARFGQEEVLAYLLDRGFDVASQDDGGHTAAHYAVMGGQVSTLRLVLARHPSLELRNQYGGTVLGQALWSAAHGLEIESALEILEMLIAAGAVLPARFPPLQPALDAWLSAHGCATEAACSEDEKNANDRDEGARRERPT